MPAERRRIGFVFQEARLFPHLSVRGNLRYGGGARAPGAPRRRFDDVVALLGIGALLERRPGQLSGGEKQRVAIGRARCCPAAPAAAGRAAGRARRQRAAAEILPFLDRLRDRLSMPIATSRTISTSVLRLATHVVLMERGRLLASGATVELSLDAGAARVIGPEASVR